MKLSEEQLIRWNKNKELVSDRLSEISKESGIPMLETTLKSAKGVTYSIEQLLDSFLENLKNGSCDKGYVEAARNLIKLQLETYIAIGLEESKKLEQ